MGFVPDPKNNPSVTGETLYLSVECDEETKYASGSRVSFNSPTSMSRAVTALRQLGWLVLDGETWVRHPSGVIPKLVEPVTISPKHVGAAKEFISAVDDPDPRSWPKWAVDASRKLARAQRAGLVPAPAPVDLSGVFSKLVAENKIANPGKLFALPIDDDDASTELPKKPSRDDMQWGAEMLEALTEIRDLARELAKSTAMPPQREPDPNPYSYEGHLAARQKLTVTPSRERTRLNLDLPTEEFQDWMQRVVGAALRQVAGVTLPSGTAPADRITMSGTFSTRVLSEAIVEKMHSKKP